MPESSATRVAVIGYEIRRELVEPLNTAKRIKPVIFYKYAGYKDFSPKDYKITKKYNNSFQLFLYLKKLNPDFIISHEPFFLRILPVNFTTWLYSSFFGKKYAFAVLENIDPEQKYGKLTNFILKFFYKKYMKKAAFIAPLNKKAGELVVKYAGKRRKINFIRDTLLGMWGVDSNEFIPEPKDSDPRLGEDSILFVGRLIEGKGVLNLLDAMQKVRNKVTNAQLYIVGDGDLKNNIIDFAGRNKWVHYLGSIKNKFLPGYFRAAKVTCVPSITTKKWAEQVGLVNIQSIACGTPVVSTISGAIPEYVPDGKTGILVKENDVDGLAAALTKLLTDEELNRTMGYYGRKLAVERYDADKNLSHFEDIVCSVIRDGNKSKNLGFTGIEDVSSD